MESGAVFLNVAKWSRAEVYLHSRVSASKTAWIWWIQNSMASWIRIWIHNSVITDPDPDPDPYY
jgi:hypothetical protein